MRDDKGRFIEKYEIDSDLLYKLYWNDEYSTIRIAKLFGCHPSNIDLKMKKYGIPTRCSKDNHIKVKVESELLWALYWGNQHTLEYISNLFNCSEATIIFWMKRYDIPRRHGRFKKGHKSWNKGLKGIHLSPKTEFKEGNVPWNVGITNEESHVYKNGKSKYICKNCNKHFEAYEKERVFCSIECSSSFISGKNSSNWRGGITSQNTLERHSKKFRVWREEVFKRDDYSCQNCKQYGGTLNAHHIKPFALFKDLRFNIDNGITLCEECHFKLHRGG